MDHHRMSSCHRILLLQLLLGLILPLGLAILLVQVAGQPEAPANPIPIHHTPELQPPFLIEGFDYRHALHGQRDFSLRADRLTVEKKRIGFLRFGLLYEARIVNGRIRIDEQGREADIGRPATEIAAPAAAETGTEGSGASGFFEPILALSPHKILSVEVRPVSFEFARNSIPVCGLAADTASIRMTDPHGMILLQGKVTAVSGTRTLQAERLYLDPGHRILRGEGNVVLTTGANKHIAQKMTLDYLLKPL